MNKVVDAPTVELSAADAFDIYDMVDQHISDHEVRGDMEQSRRQLDMLLAIARHLNTAGGVLVITPGTTVSVRPVAP